MGHRINGIASTRLPNIEDIPVDGNVSVEEDIAPACVTTYRNGNLVVASTTYNDVSIDAWYSDYVGCMIQYGIADGYRDAQGTLTGEFRPQGNVTYAELAKMSVILSRQKLYPLHSAADGGAWEDQYIAAAHMLGLTVFDQPSLNIHAVATREEVIQTVLEAIRFPVSTDPTLVVFYQNQGMLKDVSFADPYAPAIGIAVSLGIANGDMDANGRVNAYLRPAQPITRAEVAQMMLRAMGITTFEQQILQ